MTVSTVKINKYLASAAGDKKAVAMLLRSGNPAHVKNVPADLLSAVKKEIAHIQ